MIPSTRLVGFLSLLFAQLSFADGIPDDGPLSGFARVHQKGLCTLAALPRPVGTGHVHLSALVSTKDSATRYPWIIFKFQSNSIGSKSPKFWAEFVVSAFNDGKIARGFPNCDYKDLETKEPLLTVLIENQDRPKEYILVTGVGMVAKLEVKSFTGSYDEREEAARRWAVAKLQEMAKTPLRPPAFVEGTGNSIIRFSKVDSRWVDALTTGK